MLRKSQLFCILLSAISTTTWAGWGNGLYVGAGVGPDFAKFDVNAHVRQVQDGRVNFNVANDTQSAGTGVFGTLFAGYGIKFNGFGLYPNDYLYLAAELNANLSSLEHKTSNDEFVHMNFSHTKYKMDHSYGVSLIPGYMFSNMTLFYGRVGYSNGNFKISTTDTSLANTNKNLDGLRWGFGIQQVVAPQLSVRMEYDQVDYDHTSVSTLDTVSNTAKTTKFRPKTQEVEFGLVYSFC